MKKNWMTDTGVKIIISHNNNNNHFRAMFMEHYWPTEEWGRAGGKKRLFVINGLIILTIFKNLKDLKVWKEEQEVDEKRK